MPHGVEKPSRLLRAEGRHLAPLDLRPPLAERVTGVARKKLLLDGAAERGAGDAVDAVPPPAG
jgi:hypothetical protein